MKKRLSLLFIMIGIFFCLLYVYQTNINRCQIIFQYEDGRIHETAKITKGSTIPMPEDPFQINHIFIGWFTHPIQGEKYDFSQKVTKKLTLYARFQLDAVTITNEITQNIIKSLVKIEFRSYNSESESYGSGWSQGSGFCYAAGNNYYYILTNCHVVRSNTEDDIFNIRIYDYKGNKYSGYLYHDPNKQGYAISPDYDLACIYFESSNSEVQALSIAQQNSPANADIISLGAPHAQMNSITFGKLLNYSTITLQNTPAYESHVTFPVMCHTADISGGSSGGPILNSNLHVTGVNFAATADDEFGYAIPVEKIHEFLQKYVR